MLPTKRPGLLLRKLVAEDAHPLFQLIDANRHSWGTDGPQHRDLEATLQNIVDPTNPNQKFGVWEYDAFAGVVNLFPEKSEHEASIGYYLGTQFRGRGIATVSSRALVAHAFTGLDYWRLIAKVSRKNFASQRVLERIGFRRTSIAGDDVRYTLQANHWRDEN